MKWFTAPAQDLRWSLATGELPIRRSVTMLPDYARFLSTYPGIGTFAHNLDNAVKARPTLASYYKISESIGRAIQAVMLGKAQPADALAQAAKAVDAILAVPS
jgi:multiple sugar transport system substrate-binding protein